MSAPGPIVALVRHGETEWSRSGQHTSRTDLPLTPAGREQAASVASLLDAAAISTVWVSPMERAQHTAVLAGLGDYVVDEDLREWDYGEFEGLTSEQIRDRVPGWSIWEGPWRGGESAADVSARADRVIGRVLALPSGTSVALVGHGHFSRVLGARWTGAAVTGGRTLGLSTAAVCELGWEHDYRTVNRWNVVAGVTIG